MLYSTEFNTSDKHLQFHEAYADKVAIEQRAAAYEKHLSDFSSSALMVISSATAVANAAMSTELPVLPSKTVKASEHYVVHPKGVHTNAECVEQKDASNNSSLYSRSFN